MPMKRTGMTMIEKGVRSCGLRTWSLSHVGLKRDQMKLRSEGGLRTL
ncbi:hypothetical protein MKY64_22765 [Paenibacillus sp. FSL R7-0210]